MSDLKIYPPNVAIKVTEAHRDQITQWRRREILPLEAEANKIGRQRYSRVGFTLFDMVRIRLMVHLSRLGFEGSRLRDVVDTAMKTLQSPAAFHDLAGMMSGAEGVEPIYMVIRPHADAAGSLTSTFRSPEALAGYMRTFHRPGVLAPVALLLCLTDVFAEVVRALHRLSDEA